MEETRHGANCGSLRSKRTLLMSRSFRYCKRPINVSTLYLFRPPLPPSPSSSASPTTPNARSHFFHISLDYKVCKSQDVKTRKGRLRHPLPHFTHKRTIALLFFGKSATPRPQVEYNALSLILGYAYSSLIKERKHPTPAFLAPFTLTFMFSLLAWPRAFAFLIFFLSLTTSAHAKEESICKCSRFALEMYCKFNIYLPQLRHP